MREQFKTIVPTGHIGRPEEIASAAVFLASDERAISPESICQSTAALWP
jgi:NAD(P)-dependent dehydrogenase (short-subunit alcohol dehydrogenase family)